MKRDSFAYRFVILLVVYLFLMSFVAVSLSSIGKVTPLAFWLVVGVSFLLFVALVIVNEIITRKKKRK